MRIILENGKAAPQDVTEAVQIIYDALHASMDFGSGFLDTSEVEAMRVLRVLTDAAGWEPIEYDLDVCQTCGHLRKQHRSYVKPPDTAKPCLVAPSPWRVLNEPDGTPVVVECKCVAFVAEWEVSA